jgi:hypothetical protein
MASWGTGIAGDESRPKFLTSDSIKGFYDINKVWADMKGWNATRLDSQDELLVAIPGLSNSLGGATIAALEFGDGNYFGAATQNIIVAFNEQVTVSALSQLTLVVTGSVSGAITATHASTSKNRLKFGFTIPDGVSQTLTVSAQTIGAGTATVVDADGDGATSSRVISAGVAAALYPATTKTISLDNPVSLSFDAGTFVKTEATHTLTLVYDSAVTVGASGSANTIATLWSGTTGPTGPVATYASGSGSATLVFNIAAIPNEAGTLSVATQTVGGTKTLKDVNSTTVNEVISAGICTTTGTKIVAA